MMSTAEFEMKRAQTIRFTCITDTGNIREHNEDNFLFFGQYMPMEHQSSEEVLTKTVSEKEFPAVFLFDGMGGEQAGELASYAAARYLLSVVKEERWDEQRILKLIAGANTGVNQIRKKMKLTGTVGATMLLMAFNKDECWVANVGDSPAYLYRNHELKKISVEHNNAKIREEAGIDYGKPLLTMYLGIDAEQYYFNPHITGFHPQVGDVMMLCSDGLTDMVNEDGIKEVLNSDRSLEEKTVQLKDLAIKKGGEDNVTIILAEYGTGEDIENV